MKKYRSLVLFVIIAAAIMGCAAGRHKTGKRTVYIKDVRTGTAPGEDLVKYHDRDVDVFRTNTHGSSYRVYYYRKIGDTLSCFQASYADSNDMDRGTYKWENDSLVAIRLYSTVSKHELKFRVFGNRRNGQKISGMMMGD